jgi:AraC family transcriptional regulator
VLVQTAELKPLMQTLAPFKVFGARLQEPAYEVSVQDIHWDQPGEIHLLSGRHCIIELAETPAPGRARYVVQAADGQECTAGALNFMPPESERTVRWNSGNRHAVVCVMEPDRLGLLGGIDWRWGDIDLASTVDIRNDRLRTAMQWLAEETASPSFGSALQASCILTMLALELHRHFAGCDAGPRVSGKLDARQLARLKDIVEGGAEPAALSLAALAATCSLPARELSTMFKTTTGQTLRSYVASTHIARAKLLLADGELMIKQVAYRSGFRSAAAFGDAFRRATGLTPVQYRQRLGVDPRGGDEPTAPH